MKLTVNSIKKILGGMCRVGDYLSYIWFVFAIAFVFLGLVTWKVSAYDPIKTDYYCILLFLIFILYIISTLFLLHRNKLLQFCVGAIVGFFLFLFYGLIGIVLQSAPTSFAMEHSVPAGLACNTPKPIDADLSAGVNPRDTTTYLQIRNGSQGGIYEYSFYYPKLPEGTIYLKCYEVTENLPLSGSRLKKASMCHITGTDHFDSLVDGREFTIYEGDWGKYYAARIEVWFRDDRGNERKLLEKIYAVEGWMR